MDDNSYQPMYDKAIDLQSKFQHYTKGTNHPEVHLLGTEIIELNKDIAVGRDAQTIDKRIAEVQRRLDRSMYSEQPLMQDDHKRELHTGYGQLRDAMRKFENY